MARASIRTGLALDVFAKLAGIHPLHFNGITAGNCGEPILQYGWQMAGSEELPGRIGREEIAIAIHAAEQTIEQHLEFPLVPRWIESEEHSFLSSWGYPILDLHQRHYISGGIEQRTLLSEAETVVYSDEDGDGYFETATIGPFASAVVNPDEIALFYPDRSGDPTWEIRPITVEISGGNVTVVCRREQLVIWERQEQALDATELTSDERDDDALFLAEVNVYRRYNDPQRQVQFLWPNPQCGVCAGVGCASCTYTTQFGCLRALDMRAARVSLTPGDWNADDLVFDTRAWSGHGRPSRARVWYVAGFRDQRARRPLVEMADRYAQAVTALAIAMLPGPLCACMTPSYQRWSTDFALQHSNEEDGSTSFKVGRRVLDSPFGTTAGAMHAWTLVHFDRVGEAANFAAR